MTIHTVSANDVQATVEEVKGSFHVRIQDVESGLFLPSVRIYPEREPAIAYADLCVGVA